MERITEVQWKAWKKKRRNTLVGYIIIGSMVGMDYSFMFNTLYLYLKDMVKTEKPNLYYGVIIAGYSLSSTVFGAVCGRWVDKTRKIRLYTAMIIVFQIIGCLLYTIPHHVCFPLFGRLICGLGDPFASVISGEVVRIYNQKESTSALWWLASVYALGCILGPGILLLFTGVDFYFYSIHITQLNAIAVFMAAILFIGLIVVITLIHDCSAEIDLKEHLKENLGKEVCLDSKFYAHEEDTFLLPKEEFRTIPIKVILKGFVSNADPLLMFISTSVFMYNAFSGEILLPLLTLQVVGWSLNILTIIMLIYGVVSLLIYMIFARFCTDDRVVYSISILSILTQIFMFFVMIAIKVSGRSLISDIVLLSLFVLFWMIAWYIEEVVLRCMLAKMVPSNCQSFTETVRNAVSRSSTIVASFTAPLVVPFLQWWSAALIVIVFVLLIGFIVRRKHLCNIKEIDFDRFLSEKEDYD